MKIRHLTIFTSAAGLLAACAHHETAATPQSDREQGRGDYNLATSPFGTGPITHPDSQSWPVTRISGDTRVTTSPFGTGAERPPEDYTPRGLPRTDSDALIATSPDARILSILHAKNKEEIEIGHLAEQKAVSAEVRAYGTRLVRDHSAADSRVLATASAAGITLMDPGAVKRMLDSERAPAPRSRDLAADLRQAQGREFDRLFIDAMREGHAELLKIAQESEPTLRAPSVRTLVAETIPTLRHHQQVARTLDEYPPE